MDELARETNMFTESAVPKVPEAAPTPLLKAAMRRARVEEADHSDVLAELRGAEIARLEMLQDALAPVLDEIPPEADDLFDIGLMPAARPRLFIDMIAFVEMARDRRIYRFVQDTKHGRVIIAENEKIEVMVRAITDYIARRLIEREKALASTGPFVAAAPARAVAEPSSPPLSVFEPFQENRKSWREFQHIIGFVIDLLGSIVLFVLLAAGTYYALTLLASWSVFLHKD